MRRVKVHSGCVDGAHVVFEHAAKAARAKRLRSVDMSWSLKLGCGAARGCAAMCVVAENVRRCCDVWMVVGLLIWAGLWANAIYTGCVACRSGRRPQQLELGTWILGEMVPVVWHLSSVGSA